MLLYKSVSCQEDLNALQDDIDKLEIWTTNNYLHFNTAKCKQMVISRKRKRNGILPPPLTLKGEQLEQVDSYKYLGLLLSSDLSWSTHVESICSKTRKLLGLLYRQYYQLAEPHTLLQLYLSLIRPHLEYASPVWNPYLQKNMNSLENVQKFALKMCSKRWDLGYAQLLELFDVPELSERRLYLDLCTLFKIVHNHFYFPPNIFHEHTGRTHRAVRPLLLHCPFSRTNYFYNSFVLRTSTTWNALPTSLVTNASINHFKLGLRMHLSH